MLVTIAYSVLTTTLAEESDTLLQAKKISTHQEAALVGQGASDGPSFSCSVEYHDHCVSVRSYGNHEYCDFEMPPYPLQVNMFHTEQCCDKLTVNGRDYSGTEGPQGVIPNGTMRWRTDHSVNGADHAIDGFEICSVRPATTTAGPACSVQYHGDCFSVHAYGNHEYCEIEMPPYPLHVHNFKTEQCCDKLTVNGREYSGSEGPQGVVPNGTMYWRTDHSVSGATHDSVDGFEICGFPPTTTTTTTVPPCSVVQDNNCVSVRSYGDHEDCHFFMPPYPLQVNLFRTEICCDKLTVNGHNYSGTEGPQGVVPIGQMHWRTDHSVNSAHHNVDGFELCSIFPTTTTTTTIAPTTCSVEYHGDCVSVHAYGNHEDCEIEMPPYPLHVHNFKTEECCDKLTVNGREYSGSEGPQGVVPNGTMHWRTDHSVSGATHDSVDGFELCSVFPTMPPRNCSLEQHSDGCVSVRNYGHNEFCEFEMPPYPIQVNMFLTEQCCDHLLVNGIEYAGTNGPQDIVPNGTLQWSSDGSVSHDGFEICPQMLEPPQGSCHNLHQHDDGCVSVVNYGDGEDCNFEMPALPLQVMSFHTESRFDYLTVNGVHYSGEMGNLTDLNGVILPDLNGVIPQGRLVWRSDASVNSASHGYSGFEICSGHAGNATRWF